MHVVSAKFVAIFRPTGAIFYDIVVPAVIMATGSLLLAVSGLLSENAALWCFGGGALIHVALSGFAGYLMQGKEDGKSDGY